MPSSPAADDPGADDAPGMTRWERLKYSMVRPDDDPKDAERAGDPARRRDRGRDQPVQRQGAGDRADRRPGRGDRRADHQLGVRQLRQDPTTRASAVYEKLTYVLLGLAVLILLTSWLRKRLFQGITLALYRPGHLPAPLHLRRVRRPLLAGRRLVPGAGVPPAAGAQAGGGGRPRRATTQGESERCRAAPPPQQALHAAFLIAAEPSADGGPLAGAVRA